MKPKIVWVSLIALIIMIAGPVSAQDPIVYPAKGQSQDQMERDKFECMRWAREQTGFDPMKTPTATSAPPPKEEEVWGAGKTGVGRGAGAGALIGGAGGALLGGMRRSGQRDREEQRRQQWEREQANNYARARSEYNRAFGACMSGRGYTVK